MSVLVLPGVTCVYANWGRWVADCSHQDVCTAAMQVEPFTEGFLCPECGRSTKIVWPSPDMVRGVERLLMMRPHPKQRNWLPGETLPDLMLENGAHGILSGPNFPDLPGQSLLAVTDDKIINDILPVDRFPKKAIGA